MGKNAILKNFDLYLEFIRLYQKKAFKTINRNDSLIKQLEDFTEFHKQYFFVANLFEGKIIFASNRSRQMVGIDPDELNPYHNLECVHPDEVERNTKGWAQLLILGNELFVNKKGTALFSTNMRMRNPDGNYYDTLFQCYLFYAEIPHPAVYDLQIMTNIELIQPKKHIYHYYSGNDTSNFRLPDVELLSIGNIFSTRENEILKLIEKGLTSDEIAEKLFISVYTVNTHRRNILVKTGSENISELIYDLKRKGFL